jgi:4-amino-4-deoxy-L-arabinose transferase-like glycosyltransferase
MATATLPVRWTGAPAAPTVRLRVWLGTHRTSLVLLAVLLLVVGAANAWNLHGWPARVNDDEATYVDQAWAMVAKGHVAHYTYWYDHPFLGWAVIAGYAWLTDGFDRVPSAVMVGREVMLISTLVSCALVYLIGRRLGFHRATATAAVLVFGLSPVAIFYHRMVFLDNLAVMWTLAALAFAASPRRGVAAAFGSACCFAAAVLTKETAAIVLPAVVWMLAQHTDRRTRSWNLAVFATAFVALVLSYPLYALLKNELLPGPGHVSLTWALWWQLFGRSGSGSLLDPDSGTASLARSWLDIDPWLLLAGAVTVPVGLAVRRLRPLGVALLIQVLMMMRGGYLPFAYVIGLLPYCALLVGGTADVLRRPLASRRAAAPGGATVVRHARRAMALRHAGLVPLAAAALAFAVLAVPGWARDLYRQSTVDGSAPSRAATAWVEEHVPRQDVVVTDDYIWMDLTLHGFTQPVWLWKLDTDPEVMQTHLPKGYASIDYVVLADQASSTLATLPSLKQALARSHVVARFGEIVIRKVDP